MDDLLTAGVKALHYGPKGTTLKSLDDGSSFRALLAAHPAVDPGMELGYDPREAAIMQVLATLAVECGSLVKDEKKNVTWRVVQRNDNPADIVTEYTVIKVTNKDS